MYNQTESVQSSKRCTIKQNQYNPVKDVQSNRISTIQSKIYNQTKMEKQERSGCDWQQWTHPTAYSLEQEDKERRATQDPGQVAFALSGQPIRSK